MEHSLIRNSTHLLYKLHLLEDLGNADPDERGCGVAKDADQEGGDEGRPPALCSCHPSCCGGPCSQRDRA